MESAEGGRLGKRIEGLLWSIQLFLENSIGDLLARDLVREVRRKIAETAEESRRATQRGDAPPLQEDESALTVRLVRQALASLLERKEDSTGEEDMAVQEEFDAFIEELVGASPEKRADRGEPPSVPKASGQGPSPLA